MSMKHIILELYCSKSTAIDKEIEEVPSYCKNGFGEPGYHCFENGCKHIGFTYAPHEIAYSAEFGEVPDLGAWIGFGGEMAPFDADESKISELKKIWEDVCRKKIDEAYDEYFKKTGIEKEVYLTLKENSLNN
ncbi:hypothetical protein PVA17_16925 [Lysinibacillus sp. CNPSo 3705]|uniref:hypothetical protein n=1 Tax=Lysinibacillus sp. CNPSo 3705 TaxID=3028148 RepID=UPI00236381D2|nr:hypothetical protein [Lysinibacillus sp. CNPSo 3705]MDD1504427.1 hypothetical protein [Lysinibacillus sp. CNPSo 3705]